MSALTDALAAARETKALIIGKGVIDQVPSVFKQQFENSRAVVVADKTTFQVAGEAVFKALEHAGISQDKPFIFESPDLYAEYSFVEELQSFLGGTNAIPIAVGSGTINDLTKLAAFLSNRQYLCVATAASMDGYTAFGASITAQGAKQTFNCPAPQAVVADIDIISAAPPHLTASGYADLFAKITAGADWIVADHLAVEKIDDKAWHIVQDGLQDALGDPEGIRNGDEQAISKLVEGLMLGGFAMQWSKSSRPASGAEHQFSHLWNMEDHLFNGEHVSHGFQVSIGTLAITAFYESLLKIDLSSFSPQAAADRWPSAENLKAEALAIFEGTAFPEIGVQEVMAKYADRQVLLAQLNIFKNDWELLRSKLKNQLVPYEEAKRRLALVGAPTKPEQIGISRARLRETFIKAQFIRRRFTILDLALRSGFTNLLLQQLFGEQGIWDLDQATAADSCHKS